MYNKKTRTMATVSRKPASKKAASSRTRTQKNPSQTSIENGIKILQTAIRKKLSLSEASRTHNKGRNYLSDVKARVSENFKNKNISREQYSNFNALLKQYNKEVAR
jgi:hypothetical protein